MHTKKSVNIIIHFSQYVSYIDTLFQVLKFLRLSAAAELILLPASAGTGIIAADLLGLDDRA